ncbi:MAG TPA: asparagine synthase (glutamine-hydrolyzing) [Candidatus Brocadiaceae bacterium]|nr:asparagine synthase (glutamine-hydrolyzing) [Candidatus Woesearchaeota archaeon]
MCGIIGIASKSPVSDREWLAIGRDSMRHRGPDDIGEWWSVDGCVGLAHRRLSIIDLSPAGHQPMLDTTGAIYIVFNGEIYNYQDLKKELQSLGHVFSSTSDTEVMLAAYREWGTDSLRHLNGMFAFGIYDQKARRLFLARDRVGEKPLFYAVVGDALCFASELKALMAYPAFPRRIDPEALDCYLTYGYVPGNLCIMSGVNKLPPAHALLFDLESGQSRLWRYWQLPELDGSATADKIDEEALLNEMETLLEDAVRRQLVADVPVGVLLSGGVDSSLVTAMAVRAEAKVSTFTIRFPGYGAYDETAHARLIARHFGTKHIELDAADVNVDLLPILARQFDEPMVDSSMIPTYLVSKLVRQHCIVALGGDGGDELFGGYGYYSRLLSLQKSLGWIPWSLRLLVAKSAEALLPVGFKGRNWLQGLDVDLQRGLPLIASHFDRSTRQNLMVWRDSRALVAESIRKRLIPQSDNLLQRSTRMDFENYLPEDILVKVDRTSMLNSLEVRAPFLDYRIIEFAYGKVPSYLKATPTSSKVLLKKLAMRLLPVEFDHQRKQGFSIPLGSWLQDGPWKQFFHETLLGSNDMLFNRQCVNDLLDGQTKGRANSERLFALVFFELWRREYGASL